MNFEERVTALENETLEQNAKRLRREQPTREARGARSQPATP
jgi:hypothetical protein